MKKDGQPRHITTPYKKIITILQHTVFNGVTESRPVLRLFPFRKHGPHSTVTFLLTLNGEDRFVIKMPRHNHSSIAREAIEHEYRYLDSLKHNKTISNRIPFPVSLHYIMDTPVEVMPFYEGHELWKELPSEYSLAKAAASLQQAFQFLWDLYHMTATGKIIVSSDVLFIEYNITQPLGRINRYFPQEAERIAPQVAILTCWSKEQAVSLNHCLEHREFNPYNILMLKDRIMVLDWEDADEQGLPLMDLFNYAMITLQLLRRNGIRDTRIADIIVDCTRTYCSRLGIPVESIDLLFCLFMLRNTALFLDPKREALDYSKLWWKFLEKDITNGIYKHMLLSLTEG